MAPPNIQQLLQGRWQRMRGLIGDQGGPFDPCFDISNFLRDLEHRQSPASEKQQCFRLHFPFPFSGFSFIRKRSRHTQVSDSATITHSLIVSSNVNLESQNELNKQLHITRDGENAADLFNHNMVNHNPVPDSSQLQTSSSLSIAMQIEGTGDHDGHLMHVPSNENNFSTATELQSLRRQLENMDLASTPASKETLGQATWTFLHTLAAQNQRSSSSRSRSSAGLVLDIPGSADADASSEPCRAWGQVREQQSLVFFDTGARANFITPQLAEKMGIKTDEMGSAYTASMAAPGHEVAVTPLIGKLQLHIQSYVGHEEFYIMPLEICVVLLGMPWFYNHKAVLDSFNKIVTLEIRGRKIVLDVKLKGESVPLVSDSAVPRLMKQHISAYLIYVKERDETESSNLSSLDVSRRAFLDEYADCLSEALPDSFWLIPNIFCSLGYQFPEKPTRQQQRDAKELMAILSRLYPCKECADHFKEVLKTNPVQASSGVELAQWMCRVHNIVNRSLGKTIFPCQRVDARWGALDCDEGACNLQGRMH
ncbi:hypothetical protein L7F22_016127 [Adiantum nelumboides]|nr:hypothetical protein [Adiantum nelumboides]